MLCVEVMEGVIKDAGHDLLLTRTSLDSVRRAPPLDTLVSPHKRPWQPWAAFLLLTASILTCQRAALGTASSSDKLRSVVAEAWAFVS